MIDVWLMTLAVSKVPVGRGLTCRAWCCRTAFWDAWRISGQRCRCEERQRWGSRTAEIARHFKQAVIFLGNAKNYSLIIIILVLKVWDILLKSFVTLVLSWRSGFQTDRNGPLCGWRMRMRTIRPELIQKRGGTIRATPSSTGTVTWQRDADSRTSSHVRLSRALLGRRVKNVFSRLSKLMCTLKISMKYIFC